jgi:hypothetical protein
VLHRPETRAKRSVVDQTHRACDSDEKDTRDTATMPQRAPGPEQTGLAAILRPAAAAVLLAGALGCRADEPPAAPVDVLPVEEVWSHPVAGTATPQYWLVEDEATWLWFWRRTVTAGEGTLPPPVDFERHVLVVANAGGGSSYSPLMVFVGYRTRSDAVEVILDRRMYCETTDDVTQWIAVGLLPRTALPVRLIERTVMVPSRKACGI